MPLLLLIAGGIGFWLWRSGRLRSSTITDAAIAAIGLLGLRFLMLGRLMIGAPLLAVAIGMLLPKLRRSRPAMSIAEARRLLDLSDGADADAIRAAHRRIIARVHPDVGGTETLAQHINLARDTLLAELDKSPSRPRGA